MKRYLVISLFITLSLAKAAYADTVPSSFAYVLQAESLGNSKATVVERLATCGRDWVILDTSFDSETKWEKADLEAIRNGQPGRKVIAYISIGEAEDYRSYWRKEWGSKGKLATLAPAWLGTENPEWKGNYRVKYWQPDWQRLIVDSIDDAMTRGFDGVYLDIVDGFENFEQQGKEYIDDRINPETKQSYRRDMVDWVKTIASTAHKKNPAALVIPQNGSQLLANEDFLTTISAIGIEDLFTNGDKAQSKSDTTEVLGYLKKMTEAKKPVLLIEYPKNEKWQTLSKKLAHENGMTWLVTDRNLKTLGESGK